MLPGLSLAAADESSGHPEGAPSASTRAAGLGEDRGAWALWLLTPEARREEED